MSEMTHTNYVTHNYDLIHHIYDVCHIYDTLTCDQWTHNVSTIPGKTNDTRTIFGRATRHKDVCLCPIGALAFYLAVRFYITKEFSNVYPDFFLNNENWFDIRLLANAYSKTTNHTFFPLKHDTYSQSIRKVLVELGLPHHKLKHLGRGLGTKILEADDVHAEYIRQLGNWNLNATDTSYSAKLPMQPIRNAAGFVQGNGLYCNPRTGCSRSPCRIAERLTTWRPLSGCT